MKKYNFVSGFVCGAVLFGMGTALAAGIMATPSTAKIMVDGKAVKIQGYEINGSNYFKLRDIGEKVGFGISWNEPSQTIQIQTDKSYDPNDNVFNAPAVSSGAITVPQSDESFCPEVGTVIQTDNGTTFTVTKQKPRETALPTATCDWSQFPEQDLPKVQVKDFGDGTVGILNLHETRRMEYTLYNLIGGNDQVWENGTTKKYNGEPLVKVRLGITPDAIGLNSPMWPWQEEQLKEVFESDPWRTFEVEVWDEYKDGKFLHTEYLLRS